VQAGMQGCTGVLFFGPRPIRLVSFRMSLSIMFNTLLINRYGNKCKIIINYGIDKLTIRNLVQCPFKHQKIQEDMKVCLSGSKL